MSKNINLIVSSIKYIFFLSSFDYSHIKRKNHNE